MIVHVFKYQNYLLMIALISFIWLYALLYIISKPIKMYVDRGVWSFVVFCIKIADSVCDKCRVQIRTCILFVYKVLDTLTVI